MANEVEVTQAELDKKLGQAIENATAIITKSYLEKLELYDLIEPSTEDLDIEVADCGKFYKLTKLVQNKEENFLDKLTTIVNVVSAIDGSLVTIIHSNGTSVDYYLGVISKKYRTEKENDRKRRNADIKAFKGAISGNLQGSELAELSSSDILKLKKHIFDSKENCYSSVSGIVALRDEEDKNIDGYVQGIENLVDSLKGIKYTIIMLADPVNSSDIQGIKLGYEMLHTQLATFLRSSVTLNESDTISLAKARTEGVTEGISTGISYTQSTSKSKGRYAGASANIGMSMGISASVGINGGVNSSNAKIHGRSESSFESSQRNKSVSNTTTSAKTEGKGLQLNYENRSVKALLDKIDKHLERLDECESFGAFKSAAYIVANSREEALTVASNYNALLRGKDSSVQASQINTWYKPEETEIIGQYLEAFSHPRFSKKEDKKIVVTPASIVSGNELALQVGLPKKSVNGVTVVPMAPFGRNIHKPKAEDALNLGKLFHMGHDEGDDVIKHEVQIDVESLTMHTFITGSTGSGKSTTIYGLLDKLMKYPVKDSPSETVKFMVIEPAKGEYKDRFGSYDNVKVYGTNYKVTPLLKINPFSFPSEVHVLEHIDRLIEIFNVCWPMYAAMPAVLKESVERAYIASGWNLDMSECKYQDSKGNCLYPTFSDVLYQINNVMNESQYSSDSKGDYKGALCTRIKSLTNGLYGQIFASDELSATDLFDENVIIDLSRVGSSETKSLIMGLLVMKLQEHRMSSAEGSNSSLRHITVLEEAHNLLKRTSTEQSMEGANLLGKSVEMLANSIAEMRTYGEGFIIADQAPGLMDLSVIRNTNTKIILRLPDYADRELVGKAASLNEEQIVELSRLNTFVAAVYQNDWLEPVLCNMDVEFKDVKKYAYDYKCGQPFKSKQEIIEFLVLPVEKREELDFAYINKLKDTIFKLPVSSETKVAFLKYTEAKLKSDVQYYREKALYGLFNSEMAFYMSGRKNGDIGSWYNLMKDSLEPDIQNLTETEQQKIIAILAKEQAEIDGTNESKMLFNHLMKYI